MSKDYYKVLGVENKMIVQGDVFLVRAEIPQGAKRVKKGQRGFVLAEGETTGHAHVIENDIEMYEKGGILFLRTDRTVEVKHEEHKSITIDPGEWQVGRVKEFDAFEKEARNVKD